MPIPGKYTLIDIGSGDEDEAPTQSTIALPSAAAGATIAKSGVSSNFKACSLDEATQEFIKLIFDNDMFKEALIQMEIGIFSFKNKNFQMNLK